jgi:hypothetical protein
VSNKFSRNDKGLLQNMDKDGEAAAEEEVVAEQNEGVVLEATEEGQFQAHES